MLGAKSVKDNSCQQYIRTFVDSQFILLKLLPGSFIDIVILDISLIFGASEFCIICESEIPTFVMKAFLLMDGFPSAKTVSSYL